MDPSDYPNPYDWDTDEEHRDAGDRLKRHRREAESIKSDPTLQDPENQAAIRRALDDFDQQLEHWRASRRRRLQFQRLRMLPPD